MNIVRFADFTIEVDGVVDVSLENRYITVKPTPAPPSPPPLAVMKPNHAEQKLISLGLHIAAIKGHRERTGAGIRESKDACDTWRDSVDGQDAWHSDAGPRGRLQANYNHTDALKCALLDILNAVARLDQTNYDMIREEIGAAARAIDRLEAARN